MERHSELGYHNPHVPKLKIAIAGGGLVGALSACFFAKRGHEVHLFEYRGGEIHIELYKSRWRAAFVRGVDILPDQLEDIRLMEHVQGRSINLALSVRGRKALRTVGLEDEVVKNHGIPMYARMIHSVAGDRTPIPYGQTDQCIYSVGRRFLNELLLSAAEKYSNVHLHFDHKLVAADLNQGLMTFERQDSKDVVVESADLIVGSDGAYSTVRKELMKQPMFNFSQTYIEHGYLELCIPPDDNGQHKMEKNYLHIWPRGNFMMIALPNQDGSWTVTLFMPFPVFDSINTPETLIIFFQKYYPDAVPLLGKDRLVKDFFTTKPSPLVSVKCKPYHVGKTSIIIGDAAHAMVPFYGQGMNAGFEDCTLLDDMMMKHNFDLKVALHEFSIFRNPDAEAICSLAMYNYIEMRELVNKRSFIIRKKFDNILHWLFPKLWVPLYTSVTFSHMRYSDCIRNREWQDKILFRVLAAAGVSIVTGLTLTYIKWQECIEDAYHSAITRLQTQYW